MGVGKAPHEDVRSRRCSVVRSVFPEQQRGRCAYPPSHLPRPWRFLHYTHGVAARWLLCDVFSFRRQTRSRPSMCRRQNRLSSENVTVRHCCLFHLTWLRANWRRAALCLWERQGFLAGTRDEPSSMESVPDGLNRDGYASSTSLLSNPPGRRWSIGKRIVLNAMATRRLDCPAWSWPSALARSKIDNFR